MTEPQKKQNLFWAFLKAYWWTIVIILLAPVLLNFIILIPAFLPIAGGSEEWLSFHGGYIGSVIASLITLYVLYKQLQHSHAENEKTRQENQIVNKTNRQLQLNILKYEQEQQRLQEMRSACSNNVGAYSANDVKAIGRLFYLRPDQEYISGQIKALMSRVMEIDTALGFLMSIETSDDSLREFNKIRMEKYTQYMSIVQDIDILALLLNVSPQVLHSTYPIAAHELSVSVQQKFEERIIKPNLQEQNSIKVQLSFLALERASESEKVYEEMRSASWQYLKAQEKRINKILTDEHGTR